MKPRKPLWKISIATTLEAEDAVGEILSGLIKGVPSSYFDFERKISRVTVFLTNKIPQKKLKNLRKDLEKLKNYGLNIGAGKISIAKVRREDWAESWKRHFKPLEISDALLVRPSWSKRSPRANQAVVVLDPGLSFGTGQHPTTAYCLGEIARFAKGHRTGARPPDAVQTNGRSFLDIGTGSGILAIAAAKLGYKPVRAIDFDSEAVRVARANARTNGVKIKIVRGNASKLALKPKARYNLICANLILGLLVTKRQRILAQLSPGGTLVLAGILKHEFLDVQRAYEKAGMKLVAAKSEKEWRSGSFCFA